MTRFELPSMLGSVYAACEYLEFMAAQFDTAIRTEWSGTPLVAYPNDSCDVIFLRWNYERILYQIKTGVVDINDVVLETSE